VGSTLAVALMAKGYPFASIIDRDGKRAVALARAVKCGKAFTEIRDIDRGTELVFITVSDSQIREVASQLASSKKLKFGKLTALHCSGVHSAAVLRPLARKGTAVASLHPVQTFPRDKKPEKLRAKLRGIYYGLDGTELGIKNALRLVADLDGNALIIPANMKPLYHVACVFASSYMAMFLKTIAQIAGKIKMEAPWTEVFGPLMTTSMENAINDASGLSLTGPIMRKDMATLDLHLGAISASAPYLLPLYTIGGIEIARTLKESGHLADSDLHEIIKKFRTHIKSNPSDKPSKVKK